MNHTNAQDGAIELRRITKAYHKGQNQVLVHEDLNLAIAAGEFVALMGPSGCGKSTLLHLLGGLDQPTGGEVVVGGAHLEQLSESQLTAWRARHVGFVFQAHHLLPVLSARDNVELPLMLTSLGKGERRQHAEAALALVGMSERAGHRPSELSGGQEQRVAIARAIVSDPTLLLCDEPTGNLDRRTADDILCLLARLNRELGKTIVMVTHDPRAADYADRVIHLDRANDTESPLTAAEEAIA